MTTFLMELNYVSTVALQYDNTSKSICVLTTIRIIIK
jgi:hypothetical protein